MLTRKKVAPFVHVGHLQVLTPQLDPNLLDLQVHPRVPRSLQTLSPSMAHEDVRSFVAIFYHQWVVVVRWKSLRLSRKCLYED